MGLWFHRDTAKDRARPGAIHSHSRAGKLAALEPCAPGPLQDMLATHGRQVPSGATHPPWQNECPPGRQRVDALQLSWRTRPTNLRGRPGRPLLQRRFRLRSSSRRCADLKSATSEYEKPRQSGGIPSGWSTMRPDSLHARGRTAGECHGRNGPETWPGTTLQAAIFLLGQL